MSFTAWIPPAYHLFNKTQLSLCGHYRNTCCLQFLRVIARTLATDCGTEMVAGSSYCLEQISISQPEVEKLRAVENTIFLQWGMASEGKMAAMAIVGSWCWIRGKGVFFLTCLSKMDGEMAKPGFLPPPLFSLVCSGGANQEILSPHPLPEPAMN